MDQQENAVMNNVKKKVLVVDLDGTLIRSDMLYETFWDAIRTDWTNICGSVKALRRGRATLKSYLSKKSNVNVETLPYNHEVIEYIREEKKSGVHVALVTATNQTIAKKIAQFLGIFDEVHGTVAGSNLIGRRKEALLVERFGRGAFEYIGDSIRDIPVWRSSARVLTVNASSSLCSKIEALDKPHKELKTTTRSHQPL